MDNPNTNDNFNSLKEAGNQHFKAKEYEKAKKLYTKAIGIRKDAAVVYCNRAMCNLNLKLYYDALNDCNIAIRIDPNMTKAYYRRGTALSELSRYRLALDDFEMVLRNEPDNSFAIRQISEIKTLLHNDSRIDLKCYPKPDNYRSKKPMTTFPHHPNKYMASHTYDLAS